MNGFRDDITTAKAYHKAGKFPDALELYTAAAMKLMMGAGRPVDEVERLKSLAFISQQLFTFKEYESAASIITFILPEIKDAKSLDNKDSVMVDLYVQAMQCYIEEEGWKQLVYIFIDFVSVLQKIPYTELDNESLVIKLLIKCIHKLVGAGYTEEVCSIQKSMEASWIRLRYPEKDEFNAGVLSFPSSTSPIENDAPPLKQMPLPDLAPAGNQDLAPRRKESHDMEAKRRATRKQGGALRASTWTTGISDNRKERKKNHTFHGRVKGVNRKSQNNEDPSPSPSENIRRTRSLGDEQPVQNDLLVPKEEQPQPRVSQERAKTLEAPEGAARLADRWFGDVEKWSHPIIRDAQYAEADTGAEKYKRIKIAIIDTGLAYSKSSGRPDMVDDNLPRIKACMSFDGSTRGDTDSDGHGTHVAMLALRVCPNADLYIAKVASDGDKIEKLAVIQALKWAISQKVDIVNMSFGWKEVDVGSLAEELRNARRTKTLLFAATSNYGLRNLNDVAYPAISQDPFVIGIDSANGAGAHSRNLNPPSNSLNNRKWRFTAPGEGVESAYPSKLESSGLKRLDGTSFASPIAAGVAAMVLEFALQPPLNLEPQIYQILKGDGFLWILHDLLSSKMADTLPFRFILPWQLFHGEELDNETVIGGSADKAGSPRRRAAERIVECLRVYLGVGNVGKEFYDKLNAPTAVKVDSSVSESIP